MPRLVLVSQVPTGVRHLYANVSSIGEAHVWVQGCRAMVVQAGPHSGSAELTVPVVAMKEIIISRSNNSNKNNNDRNISKIFLGTSNFNETRITLGNY